MPTAATRAEVVHRLFTIAVALVLSAVLLLAVFSSRAALVNALLWVIIGYAIANALFTILLQKRGKRILHDAHYMICPECRYVLHGLGDSGNCPECGKNFIGRELARQWQMLYGKPRTK